MPPTSKAGPHEPGLDRLETLLGHSFLNKKLLLQALTHSSLAYERKAASQTEANSRPIPDDADNEQLEFLGDAVVGLLVAESLCKRFPQLKEGQLSRLRAALVSRRHLGDMAERLNFGEYLRLGCGEEGSGGRKKNAILANCIEAVIGALYLDAGLDAVRLFVEREIVEPSIAGLLQQMERGSTIDDHKSALQELLQARHLPPPQYAVTSESGPDHRKRFVVEVRVPESTSRPIATGTGTTKKRAEQEAARCAFEKLRSQQQPATQGAGAAANSLKSSAASISPFTIETAEATAEHES